MQHSQQQAAHAFDLKDAYVKGVKGEVAAGRLIPGIAQQPAILQASGHAFLDEGKEGVINDGDPSMYFHKGGNTHQFHQPDLRNPAHGGPGERQLRDMEPNELDRLRNQFDDHEKYLQDQRYGTGNLAQFQDPMTVKHVMG
ncbi:hypothetical protein [Synechococcus sp. WH 8016]|uniref:hypothetical protein n=1 Tax=Synechococcus sp. WH 8016 TaxID=166318 RepID=UPI00022DA146|nr:hypothetical protein [Synechococcus sp. WH 8016]EHA63718.1 hypothetical protein Syn8016DRAFT_0759 [Synechococcus sp. WH 8016]